MKFKILRPHVFRLVQVIGPPGGREEGWPEDSGG